MSGEGRRLEWVVPSAWQVSDLAGLATRAVSERADAECAGMLAAIGWVHGRLAGPVTGREESPERFEQVIARERDERGFHRYDPAVQARLMFGMVLSIAVHGDWMFDGYTGPRPGESEFVEAMTRMTIHGAYDRPGHPSWEG